MDSFRIVTDADGIAVVWFDTAGKSVNTLGPATLGELSEVVGELEKSKAAGVIFASAKAHNFIAGADLFEIREMDAGRIEQFLGQGQSIFQRIEDLPMPTAAAINGDCLGGGLELALACRYRVAAQEGSIKIGLPEVKLGILPGFGGTVRMTRVAGLSVALPLLLAGKTLSPKKALRAGIIDEVAREEALLDAARRLVRGAGADHRPTFWNRAAASVPIVRRKIIEAARKETEKRSFGHYPAPMKILDVVDEGLAKGSAGGFDAERRGLLELMQTDACRNLMRLFFLRQGAKRAASGGLKSPARAVEYAAVVGGGTMGAGIVHALAGAGIHARLIEVDDRAVSAGLGRIRGMFDQDVRDGRLSVLEARHAMSRVAPTTQWDGLKVCDFAIEAVVEKMESKREVFARLDKLTSPHAVLASNTSSLSIGEMGAATGNAGRVVGMHFFNPVPKMPLVEIVRSDASDGQSLATAIGLAGKLGKTPVLVRDAPGFLVNRVLIPYLAEAALLGGEGGKIARIDLAMKRFGWPMGPFELLDEIGLDIGNEVLKTLGGGQGRYASIPQRISRLLDRGWLGKKSGMGFYVHDAKAKRDAELKINPGLREFWETETAAPMADAEIQSRLMGPMLNEAGRLLEEGVTESTDAIDLATVLGLGFPPFRGGLARYAETVGKGLGGFLKHDAEAGKSELHPAHA